MQINQHILYKIIFCFFVCTIYVATSSAQSISHLVRWNTIKNTELVARDVHKSEDHIFTVYEYIRRDTLFFEGQPLGTDTLPFEQLPILISKLDEEHKLLKSGVFTTARRFAGNMNYQNVRYLEGHIYVFVSIHDEVLRYNGETIWTGTPTNNIQVDHWFVMVKLDEELNFMEAKGIDHWGSGFEDIAFTEDRMYLFGRISNGLNFPDTVAVDGYDLITLSKQKFATTNIVIAYNRHTGQILGDTRINVRTAMYYLRTAGAGIGKDGYVYQLINTASYMELEDGTTLPGYFNHYNTTLFKYDQNGEMVDYIVFYSNQGSETYLDQMHTDAEGNIYLHGRVAQNLGFNGVTVVQLPLPHSAMVMCLDGGDMQLKWYDYIAVQHTNTTSIYGDGLHVDKDDNVYVSSSFRTGVTASVDKNGQPLLPGTHVIKYDKNGEIKRRTRWENRKEEPVIRLTGGQEDNITIFRHQDAIKDQFDSISMETCRHYNQMFLFEQELGQISSVTTEEKKEKAGFYLYPNPVHKNGVIGVSGWEQNEQCAFSIYDVQGGLVCRGWMDDSGRIDLKGCVSMTGIYWIQIHPNNHTFKIVVTE